MTSTDPTYRFIVCQKPRSGCLSHSTGFVSDAHALGLQQVTGIEAMDLYFIQGALDVAQLDRIGKSLLSDPVTQQVNWRSISSPHSQENIQTRCVEVTYLAGVTDPVAEQIVRASHQIGITTDLRAATGQRFVVSGQLDDAGLHTLARRLFANPVIQRYALGEISPVFPEEIAASGHVEMIPICNMDDAGLQACSLQRRAALDLYEMRAIQAYFQAQGRDCTDVEFEMIAQTWSEHCVHKTFRALIDVESGGPYPAQVDNILNSYIRKATDEIAAPWVISAFKDNAGIIEFDGEHEISFKVETHNHPSAVEPFGGANTGVGGVIRDVMGVSAKPIATTDILCFGAPGVSLEHLPDGVLHPRRVFNGVVAGVQDYGNKMGIPTVNGAIWFDEDYAANPLVYCGCVGMAPKGRHRFTPHPGDHVIVLGGRTGRDGLRGATFSSLTMDAQTGEVSGASVQIGAPITEKAVMEVLLRARDQGLYHAVTDCGAGGLSSAVGEMAAETGAKVDLANVRLKYPGLAPWEIWLSEAQER
ncbi:MAG: phosphoribosylformylglycinamidine synthase, partial [Chloroflexi bacterium]|nr:phosphoribosylformylglycinamidine synthase [Chloroflexota bacterium]